MSTPNRRWLTHFRISSSITQYAGPLIKLVEDQGSWVQCLATRVDVTERAMFQAASIDYHLLATCIETLTGIDPAPSVVPRPRTEPRNREWDLLSLLVACYRMFDDHLREPDSPLAQIDVSPIPISIEVGNLLPADWHLKDWTSVLLSVEEELQRESRDVRDDPDERNPDLVKLVKRKLRSSAKARVVVATSNMYTAALYLRCLCDPTKKGEMLSLSSGVEVLVSCAEGSSGEFSQDELVQLKKLTKDGTWRGIRQCFEVAMVWSPVQLLTQRNIPIEKCKRKQLIETNLFERKSKPAGLHAEEKSLTRGLASIAFENANFKQVVRGAAAMLLEMKSSGLDLGEPWFAHPVEGGATSKRGRETVDEDDERQSKRGRFEDREEVARSSQQGVGPRSPAAGGAPAETSDQATEPGSFPDKLNAPNLRPQLELNTDPQSLKSRPASPGASPPFTPSNTGADQNRSSMSPTTTGAQFSPTATVAATPAPSGHGRKDGQDGASNDLAPLYPTVTPNTSAERDRSSATPATKGTQFSPTTTVGPTPAATSHGKEDEQAADANNLASSSGSAFASPFWDVLRPLSQSSGASTPSSLTSLSHRSWSPLSWSPQKPEATPSREPSPEIIQLDEQVPEPRNTGKTSAMPSREGSPETKQPEQQIPEKEKRKQNKGKGKDYPRNKKKEPKPLRLPTAAMKAQPPVVSFEQIVESLLERGFNLERPEPKAVPFESSRGEGPPRSEGGPGVSLFDAYGGEYTWAPRGHTDLENRLFYSFYNRAQQDYDENGLPPHVSKPERSTFKRLTQKEFDEYDPIELQELHRKYDLIVCGPAESREFSKTELGKIAPLDKEFVLHDYSKGWGAERHTVGTLADVYNEHNLGMNGKIVNVLDIPQLGPLSLGPLFGDLDAYYCMQGKLPFISKVDYPLTDMRWALVATGGASHAAHIDAGGASTFVKNVLGFKYWMVAVPLEGQDRLQTFNNLSLYHGWDPAKPRKNMRVEGMVIRPGETLYMRSLTTHVVFTPDSSICVGGHYFCPSTFTDTVAGYITAFHMDAWVTNTSHVAMWKALAFQVITYHHRLVQRQIPHTDAKTLGIDLSDWNIFHGFILLHVLICLIFPLDPRSYNKPVDAPRTEDEEIVMTYARGVVLYTMEKLDFKITPKGTYKGHASPKRYFNAVLIDQVVLLMNAHAVLSTSKRASGPRKNGTNTFVDLLRDALSHDEMLWPRVVEKNLAQGETIDPSSLPAVPLSQGGIVHSASPQPTRKKLPVMTTQKRLPPGTFRRKESGTGVALADPEVYLALGKTLFTSDPLIPEGGRPSSSPEA
ncbi:hypothetical protein D9611_014452 [Ephemerocybe angulata]|uniref:JmjC domain-containing protein n=1 Tax=Ephemerocybe angulata TaxID=980116 RepID=A0A8H5ERS5_9AGAR|nr:hypothetical protein D9611_014452 [Tulosesus angulatus]